MICVSQETIVITIFTESLASLPAIIQTREGNDSHFVHSLGLTPTIQFEHNMDNVIVNLTLPYVCVLCHMTLVLLKQLFHGPSKVLI